MNSFKKHILRGVIGAMFIGAMASCSEDSIISPEDPNDVGVAGGITFRCSDMLETFVGDNNPAGTRAAASKSPEEKAIRTLHIFFFNYDEEGKLIDFSGFDNFQAYRKETNTSFIKIPTSSADFDNQEGAFNDFQNKFKNVRIVAIANIDATDEANNAEDPTNKFKTIYSPEGKILKAGRNEQADIDSKEKGNGGHPFEITCYDDLKKWVYYPRIRMNEDGTTGDISKLPDAGMPMIGEYDGPVDLTVKETRIVNLTALMAKVNVSVKLDPDQYTDEYPLLKITGYGVRNMPIAVPFERPDGNTRDGSKPTKPEGDSDDSRHADYFAKYNVTDVPMFHKGDNTSGSSHFICPDEAHEFLTPANVIINKDSEPVTFSYYTFENINLPDYNAKRANGADAFNSSLEAQYPDEIKNMKDQTRAEAMKERWKSTFAYSDRASALILKGDYTTHQGLTYKAQFTVYLGRSKGIEGVTDPNIDFQVKRNYQYDNNIVIIGLDYIRNSDDGVYNFDGRVNVVDDNPFYLAIVNERKVDAHATALPMDVWFMLREDGEGNDPQEVDWKSQIKFTIRDHEDAKKGAWLRMEKVTREQMAKDERSDGGLAPFSAGKGARPYFTTDLVTNTLKNNYEITIDADVDKSRSRIYFYIDENVPVNDNVNTTDKSASNYYGDRTAVIDVVYTRKDKDGKVVDKRERTLEIEQRGLLKVSGTWTGNDGKTDNIATAWMEVYEEYLAHNDPLDKHEMPGEYYSGLPWGLRGKVVYTANPASSNFSGRFQNPENWNNAEYYYRVYYKIGGFAMTEWAINKSGISVGADVKLYNTKAPTSAFHYCFGKNKRNNQGTPVVSTSNDYKTAKGWYMPGIRELEKALVDYYGMFPEFRGNFYWSAACAEAGNDNARATQVKTVTTNGVTKTQYENSGTGEKGCQDRNNSLRIRAFYRAQ